ncbi:hypothetical protein N7540_002192 [Penicillium herquei]|nr:hypothetical protein N7540_002192 [Penicillium herquei]
MLTEYRDDPEGSDGLNEQQQEHQSRHATSQENEPRGHTCVYCGTQTPLTNDKVGSKIDVEELHREIARTKKLVKSILKIKKTNHVISIGGSDDSIRTRASTKGKDREVGKLLPDKAPNLVLETAELERESREAGTAHLTEDAILDPQAEFHALMEKNAELENNMRGMQSKHEQERKDWSEKTAKQAANSQNLLHELQECRTKLREAELSRQELKDILSKMKGGTKLKEAIFGLEADKNALKEKNTKLDYQVRGQRLEIQSLTRRLIAEDQANNEWKYKYVGSI